MPTDKLQVLHDNLTKMNPEFKVPLAQFETDMQDENKLKTLHENLAKQHSDFTVPFEQFKSDMWSNRPVTQPAEPAAEQKQPLTYMQQELRDKGLIADEPQATQTVPEIPVAAPSTAATPAAPQLSFQDKGFEMPNTMGKVLPTEKTSMEQYFKPAIEQTGGAKAGETYPLGKIDELQAQYLRKTKGDKAADEFIQKNISKEPTTVAHYLQNVGKAFAISGKSALAETGIAIEDQTSKVNELLKNISDNPTWQNYLSGEEQRIGENLQGLKDYKTSSGKLTGKPGEFIGAMLPFAGMAAASIATKSPALASTMTGVFGEMGYGSGIEAYDEYKKTSGEPVDEAARTGAGILYGAAMSIPISSYLGKMMPKGLLQKAIGNTLSMNPEATTSLGKEIFESFAKESPSLAKKLAQYSAKGALHGAASMEAMELSKKAVDQYLIGRDVKPEEWWGTIKDAAASGVAFGLMTAPFAAYAQTTANKQRREAQGSVTLTMDTNNKPVEVIPTRDGAQQGLTPDGKIVEVTSDMAARSFTIPTKEFNEAMSAYKTTGEVDPQLDRIAYGGRVRDMLNGISGESGTVTLHRDAEGNNFYILGKTPEGEFRAVDSNGVEGNLPADTPLLQVKKGDAYNSLLSKYGAAQAEQAKQSQRTAEKNDFIVKRDNAEQTVQQNFDALKQPDGNLHTGFDKEGNEIIITSTTPGGMAILQDGRIVDTRDLQNVQARPFEALFQQQMTEFDVANDPDLKQAQPDTEFVWNGRRMRIEDLLDGNNLLVQEIDENGEPFGRQEQMPKEDYLKVVEQQVAAPEATPELRTYDVAGQQIPFTPQQDGTFISEEIKTPEEAQTAQQELTKQIGAENVVDLNTIPGADNLTPATYQLKIRPKNELDAEVVTPAAVAEANPLDKLVSEGEAKQYTLNNQPIERGKALARVKAAIFANDRKKIEGLDVTGDEELTKMLEKAFPVKITIGKKKATTEDALNWIDASDTLEELRKLQIEGASPTNDVKNAYALKVKELVPEVSPEESDKMLEGLFAPETEAVIPATERAKEAEGDKEVLSENLRVYRGGSEGDYYTPSKEHAAGFGEVKSYEIPKGSKVFDINNAQDFKVLLDKVGGEITFDADNSIFKSFEDFTNHDAGDIIAEANNSWIVEKYANEIKELGFDIAKFMDGGEESLIIVNKSIKPINTQQQDDNRNTTGLPSSEQVGETVERTRPVEAGSGTQAPASGDVQGNGQGLQEKREGGPSGTTKVRTEDQGAPAPVKAEGLKVGDKVDFTFADGGEYSGAIQSIEGAKIKVKSDEGRNFTVKESQIHKGGKPAFKKKGAEAINVDGVDRPTINSKGQPIHSTEEGLQNFWKWFGDSKVVDEQGRPLVVYHSSLQDIEAFNSKGQFMGYTGVSGISATDNPEMASRYLDRFGEVGYVSGKPYQNFQKNVLPVYLKSERLLEQDAPFKTAVRLGAPLPEGYVSEVEKLGYDGLVRNDAISRGGGVKHSDAKNAIRGKEYVVFSPTQIKSATGNLGTFNPEDARISFKKKPSPSKLADLYKTRLAKLKQDNPKTYWSVDLPSDADLLGAAKDGRLVDMNGGMAYVTKDGDLKGLFKYDPTAKGTAKVLQAERIKMGGIKLDAYDTEGTGEVSLVPTYKKNGFREVARVDFNPEYAPPDMPDAVKAMNPDVVVMVYDPENKLPIKERRFNKEQYEDALAYRDSYITEEPIPDHNKSGDTHDFFSDVVTGASDKFKPRRKWEPLMEFSPAEEAIRPTFERFNGNFDEHIATSIPGFRDIQIKTASAINEMLGDKGGLIYDIGGSEGGWVKTITELSDGKIKSINLDANGEMQAVHNATPVKGSTFVKEAFGPGFEWDGVEYLQHEPKRKADVVHESMTFQFIDEKRGDKLDELVEKYIKPDGLFITEEKIHPKSQEQWAANEAKKDADFKLKYYDQDQISAKRDEVLTGMVTNQTTYERYKNELLKKFDYVQEYWDSGNFKGIVASNDKVKVDEFLANVGNTDTEFSEKNNLVGVKKENIISVDGVDRPTINSKGQPIHSTEEGIQNFWKWFGDSKVVDEQGRPLVIYHGTREKFEAFKGGKIIFLSTSEGVAKYYAGDAGQKGILEVYANIENPYVLDAKGSEWDTIKKEGKIVDTVDVGRQAYADGNDGAIITNIYEAENKGSVIMAFDPTQIKSATGNLGTFNPADARISYKKKPFSLLSMVDKAAAQTDTNPSEAQIEAGNYAKGKVNIQGMEVSIENPKGSVRRGTDEDGKAWETKMKSHYGYFKGTVGKDGDHVDTFIGPNPENSTIFVVDQNNPKTGEFDESKVMLGYNTLEEAKSAYLANYQKGWDGLRDITSVGVEPFKKWLYDGARQRKPFGEYVGAKPSFMVKAYHGTPYTFEKFSTEKIGTGEGMQAFGWGLYFTDVEGIAKDYAKRLSENTVLLDNVSLDTYRKETHNPVFSWIDDFVQTRKWNKEQILDNLNSTLEDTEWLAKNTWVEPKIKEALKVIEGVKEFKVIPGVKNLYEVKLHEGKDPSEYDWLVWDKDIPKSQIDKINAEAIKEFGKNNGFSEFLNYRFLAKGDTPFKVSGETTYEELIPAKLEALKTPKEVSEFLLRAGIEGVKYPSGTLSGGKTEGHNYVVFDENAVTISERISFKKGNPQVSGEAVEVTPFLERWESDAKFQTPIYVLGNEAIADHFEGVYSEEVLQEIRDTEFWGVQLDNEIFFSPDIDPETALVAWAHEKSHVVLDNSFNTIKQRNEYLLNLYNELGEKELKRVLPEEYWDEIPTQQAKEYLAHLVEDTLGEGKLLESVPEHIRETVKNQINEFTTEQYLVDAQTALRNARNAERERNTLRPEANAGAVQEISGDQEGNADADLGRIPSDASRGKEVKKPFSFEDLFEPSFKEKLPETVSVDGIYRPTLNSKGLPIHSTEEGIRNFWKWFGDSKVVDKEGRPLVVYHGTDKVFDSFDPEGRENAWDAEYPEGTIFLADEDRARMYGKIQMPLYVKIEQPIAKTVKQRSPESFLDNDYSLYSKYDEAEGDGIIVKGVNPKEGTPVTVYAVFNPTQIKSATGNLGGFDPTDPRITFKRKPFSFETLKKGAAFVPGVTETTEAVKQVNDAFQTTMLPYTQGEGGKLAAQSMRANLGEMQRGLDVAEAQLREAKKRFDTMSNDENLDFIDRMENNLPQTTPELTGYAKAIRKQIDEARDRVRALGTGKLDVFIENYFPHYWENPKKAEQVLQGVGRRPLEGPKSFLKQRTINFTKEGVDKGLIPVSWNPITLSLLKIREMERYTMAHRTLNELKEAGYVKFFRLGQDKADDFVAIDDRISTVMKMNPDTHMLELLGHYYAEKNAARILNNYLSKGLRGNAAFDLYRGLGNTITQLQLGLSAFHLGFTSMDAAISAQALGWEYLYHGDIKNALVQFAKTPIAPVTNFLQGDKLLKAWYGNAKTPEMALIADMMAIAGGRAKMDEFYAQGWKEKIKENVRNRRLIKAGLQIPLQLVELTSQPILGYIVPRQKLGVFMDMAKYELKTYPNATPEERRIRLQKAWNSVDNRMGQLVYDNLFWNRVTKDVAMATVRSVGWNLGTFREVGGAPKEAIDVILEALKGKTAGQTHKLGYMISLVITTAISSAIFQYLRTGKAPEEPKDYFFPKDGGIDKNGDATRASMPSYVKDLYHYGHAFPSGALSTLKNKLSPVNGIVAQMISNKDYYGTKVYNEDDPIVDQTKEIFNYLGEQLIPFGIRNVQKSTSDKMIDKVLPFIGIVPAPYMLNMTEAELKMSEIVRAKLPIGGRTKIQAEHSEEKKKVRNEFLKSKDDEVLNRAAEQGLITDTEADKIWEDAQLTPLERDAQRLTAVELYSVYKIATPEEKQKLVPIILDKAINSEDRDPSIETMTELDGIIQAMEDEMKKQ